MAYTKYSLTPANNTAAPPDGAPEGMLPSAVNDTMRDMMAQIRDCGDGIRDGTYTMTAPKITGGTITGAAFTGNTFTSPVISGGSINNTTVGATTRSTGAFTTLASNGATTFTAGTASTSTTTGTAVITGGLGVSGRINAANFDGIVGANTAAAGNFTTLGATSFGVIGARTQIKGTNADITGATGSGTEIFGGSTPGILAYNRDGSAFLPITINALTVALQAEGTTRGLFSSSGLAVTGTIGGTTTIGVGAATPAASGAGITFPATQSASSDANTLDDYEEGTWTPEIRGGSTAGTTTYASNRTGRYTKIGNMVTVQFTVGWTNATGTGALEIWGLPFTTNTTQFYDNVGAVMSSNLDVPNGGTGIVTYAPSNSTLMNLYVTIDNAGLGQVQMDTAANIYGALTYNL
jgi:hypothetical protein